MGGSGPICLPTNSHLGQSGGEFAGLPVQENHSDCSRIWDLVTISSQIPLCLPNLLTQPFNQTPHRNLSNLILHTWPLESRQSRSRASLRQWQHKLRLLKENQPVCEAKWTIFTKWCLSNQVDFRASPIKSKADFLLYLFQDRKLQPSKVNGYRSAIADKLGNSPINVSKDQNLARQFP